MYTNMFGVEKGNGYAYGLYLAAQRGWEYIDIESHYADGREYSNVGKVGDTERAWQFNVEEANATNDTVIDYGYQLTVYCREDEYLGEPQKVVFIMPKGVDEPCEYK